MMNYGLSEIILSQIYYYKGVISQKQELFDIAAVYFQQSLDYDSSNLKSAYSLASCENQRGNFAKALEDYTYALDTETLSQSKRQINNLGSLVRQRSSTENLQAFPDSDIFEKINLKSPSPQKLPQQEATSNRTSYTGYKKFFTNVTAQTCQRDSIQSPVSFNGDGFNFNDYISKHEQEEMNSQSSQNNQAKQKSKQIQVQSIKDLTKIIIQKKSPPAQRDKRIVFQEQQLNSNQSSNTHTNRAQYINSILKDKNKKQPQDSFKNKENMELDHFKKGLISSGEVSSITPQSTSINNSRISSNNITNQQPQSPINSSLRNLSSLSILKQINKVQKSGIKSPLNKSGSTNKFDTQKIQIIKKSPLKRELQKSLSKMNIPNGNRNVQIINIKIENFNQSNQTILRSGSFEKAKTTRQISNHTKVMSPASSGKFFQSFSNDPHKKFSPSSSKDSLYNNSISLTQKYFKMITKKQYSECLNLLNQHIFRNSFKQIAKYMAYFLRGLVYYRQRNLSSALFDFKNSVLCNQQSIQQCEVILDKIDYDDINSLTQTTRTIILIGKSYLKLRDFENTMKVIQSLELNDSIKSFKFYVFQSQFYFNQDPLNRCRALVLKSSNQKSLLFRGYINKSLGNLQLAIEDFKSITSDKLIASKNINYELSQIYFMMDEIQLGLFYIQKEIDNMITHFDGLDNSKERELLIKILKKKVQISYGIGKGDRVKEEIQDLREQQQIKQYPELINQLDSIIKAIQ